VDRKQLYKETYDFEIERKDRLTASISTPITVQIAAVIGFSYIVIDIGLLQHWYEWLSILFLAGAAALLAFAVTSLVQQNFGYDYGYLPMPDALESYYRQLRDYYDLYGDQIVDGNLERDFEDYVVSRYIAEASRNGRNNDKRSSYIYRANLFTVLSLIPLAIAYMIHILALLGLVT